MLVALLMSVALQGVVVARDGSPLRGVSVTFMQGAARKTVITDTNGKFAFPNAAGGPYAIQAELNGFVPAVVEGSDGAPMKITMQRSLDEREVPT